MLTRRSFLTHSTLTLVSGSLIAGGNTTPESTFVHHVFFWLKDKQNKDDYNKLVLSLKDLKKIKQIKLLHVGSASISPLAQEASITDATYDISLLTFFENMQDKESYLVDPLHKKFIEECKNIISKVIVYDSSEL